LITARPGLDPVAEWLENHLSRDSFSRLRLAATGDHDNKGGYIREMGLTCFVDDRVATCNLLAGEDGITPIVYEQPWNYGRHQLFSVKSWRDIKSYVDDGRQFEP
jgi:hypothetical protein